MREISAGLLTDVGIKYQRLVVCQLDDAVAIIAGRSP